MPLTDFHPAINAWFHATFGAPTPAQAAAWPAIHRGRHTLVAAPTGSGKTLAAFLAAIDNLVRQGLAGTLEDATQLVYVSPLKALSNDIERNLQQPLAGIRAELSEIGLPDVELRVQVRTGDTPPGERAAMKKRPPHILVTTPESLYLLLTSASGRAMLATTRTVIVDEIHAVAASKRGAHLALSLERLAALTPRLPVRIGLSATQKPIDEVARFLTGGAADCTIVDTGHTRARDLALELPPSPLEAVMAGEVWEQVYDRLAELIRAHRVTLVFANTRRLTERVTRHLSERLGKENVAAHHGSLSREQRLDAEQRLKHGSLRALVATASLELGIDIGDVELVVNLGSPRSIATLLQRVGRANHAVGGTPKGRLFPLTRDELIECTALLRAIADGELDRLRIPVAPLDVLAQQLVAEVASRADETDDAASGGGISEDELYTLVRRAYPYRNLAHDAYLAVVRMLADGYTTRRGRAGAYLHRDAVNHRLRARKGARLTALTCGGAIPDNADYRVLLEPGETFIGTLNEDFAIESMAGDIFQLGNASYRILKIESGKVRVEDAKGAPPSIPFWFGEAPARTDELSQAVSALRAAVDAQLAHISGETIAHAVDWLMQAYAVSRVAAEQIIEYLAAAKGVLGVIPTQENVVLERFFDESGGMQLVIHAPFGSRINRAWGLSLRKRFCRQFNFELQAAATEDSIVLSLGETHSFPLDEVARYLNSKTVREVLVQALLDAPLFTTRWRWNATIALAIKRARGGAKRPAAFQRMDAEDLIAVVFPDQIACAENLRGEREVPSHPLVDQTIADCLHEAMDIDGLVRVLAALERGEIHLLARDLPHPSPLAQEILNAKPYAFLDDAPLEERRTQAVSSRRWLDPLRAADMGRLDPQAIAQVAAEAWPAAENADELHDALLSLAFVTETEGIANRWTPFLERLVHDGRAARLTAAESLWVAAESVPMFQALLPSATLDPVVAVPAEFMAREWAPDSALVEIVRARLQGLGPTTATRLAQPLGVTTAAVDSALAALEHEGFAMRGRFNDSNRISEPTPPLPPEEGRGEGTPGERSPSPSFPLPEGEGGEPRGAARTLHNIEWCERRLLARIHRYTIKTLRAEIEPVSAQNFMRFLFAWHGLTSEPRPEGPQALANVIAQLEGYEAAAAAWESDILPARLHDYDPAWLDSLCLSGRTLWARLTPPKPNGDKERASGPVRATPIAFLLRAHRATWQALRPADGAPRLSAAAGAIAAYLRAHGASFFDEMAAGAGLLRAQAETALAELVAAGMVHADSFSGLRALLLPADRRRAHGYRRRRAAQFGLEDAGRWTLLPDLSSRISEPTPPLPLGEGRGEGNVPYADQGSPHPHSFSRREKEASRGARERAPAEDNIEQIARLLLARYGVVFRRLLEREAALLPPWHQLLRVYRRLEARGEIRGGRFVGGFAGEQYALPDAVGLLRETRRRAQNGVLVSLSAVDPLSLVGVVTPGTRVPALAGNRVLYRDGEPIAVQVAREVRFLTSLTPSDEWAARTTLQRSPLHDTRALRRPERDVPLQ